MSKDVEIIGALTVNKRLDINNKNLYVTDLTISGLGSLTMDKKDSYICVSNNMLVASGDYKTPGSSLKEGKYRDTMGGFVHRGQNFLLMLKIIIRL